MRLHRCLHRTGKTVNFHVPLFADKSLIPLTATETAEHEEVALLTEITKMRSIFLASSLHDDAIFSFSENESVITRLFIENVFARAQQAAAVITLSLNAREILLLNRLINRDARPLETSRFPFIKSRLKVSRVYAAINALLDIFVVLTQRVTRHRSVRGLLFTYEILILSRGM